MKKGIVDKTTSDKYRKLTQREHVILRKNMYCGDSSSQDVEMYVVDNITELENIKLKKKKIKYNPAFIKLFDEIISNASDSSIRYNNVSYIKVNVDVETNMISVENDCKGGGIPIKNHTTEKCYIPEMIFSHFLTGENYDDNEEKVLAGQNGLGSKIVNVLSKYFKIDLSDGKKNYIQEFSENLSIIKPPKITKSNKYYVKVSYIPDFSHFNGLDKIDDDTLSIILKRIVDLSIYNNNVKFYFNNKLIKIKTFKDWMKLHLDNNTEMYIDDTNDKWIYGVAKSPTEQFEQISIASSVSTYRGGTHVNYLSLNLSKAISESFPKKIKVNWFDVKNKMVLFLISKIPNPTFDSQTKESLTNQINKEILNNLIISDSLVKKIMKSDIVESILHALELKEKEELRKLQKSSQKLKIEKLVDANSNDRKKCQILIFEGECLEEKTNIRIIDDNGICDKKIKDVEIGDIVITHKNRLSIISSITKKIAKKVIIKNKLGNIECSSIHKWFVYDTKYNKFYFVKTSELDKNIHKLVKNYLAFLSDLIKINDIIKIKDDKYHYRLILDGYEEDLFSTSIHKFACYNIQTEYFEMISCENLVKDIHLIVNLEDNK